ncbi:MAG: HDOD domain-containing protein [Alphaproteobacteria bacterium]|uniref:HDOD domain-containing protein n=1 Tax=Candidatus Nitrobium versatile TaxID=2884831 RepID=A0A953LW95_9BACT|nr:HDOD domain-containing protein [Candidatus Nitrobium versatile]
MDIQVLRAQIEKIDTLPTIPTVLKKLLAVIENPKVSMNDISGFISNDPVLTSRVLKVVNSPIYGFPGRISSVSQALILLGLNVVRGMLLGVSVFEAMQKTMQGLWEHSLGCAVTARIIAIKKGVSEPEEVSIAALLHDIGKVVLGLKFPGEYKEIMTDAERRDLLIFEGEKDRFGITHADAGAWVAQKWNFPRGLIEVIEYHHKPHLSRGVPLQTAIVHLSDILVRARGFGFAGDNFVPPLHPSVWQTLRLSEGDIKEILMEAEESLEQAEDFILSEE